MWPNGKKVRRYVSALEDRSERLFPEIHITNTKTAKEVKVVIAAATLRDPGFETDLFTYEKTSEESLDEIKLSRPSSSNEAGMRN